MPRFTMILTVDGSNKFFVGEDVKAALPELKDILNNGENVFVSSMSIEGINAFNLTQNGSDQFSHIVEVLEGIQGKTPSEIAKLMYTSIFNKIDMLEAHNHIERIKSAERINPYNNFREIAKQTKGLFHFEWQGFEFLLT